MDINDLFENIAKIINQFTNEMVAERTKNKMSISALGPESEGKNSENFAAGEKQNVVDFPNWE